MKNSLALILLLVVSSVPIRSAEKHWNQFRGPDGNGVATAVDLPVHFDESRNVQWKTRIPGEGWSSPVVWGDEIWLTSGRRDSRELRAVCMNIKSGRIVKDLKVFDMTERFVDPAYVHDSPHLNSVATPTPVVEETRVFVSFGSQGLACLNRVSGEVIWSRRDLRVYQPVRQGSSPIADDKHIYVPFDGTDRQFVVALNKDTGETAWCTDRDVSTEWDAKLSGGEKPRDNKKSFATPHLIEVDGQRQLIAPAAEATIAYHPDTGRELWRVLHPGGFNVAARPVHAHGLVYVFTSGITGYLMGIRPSGSGDVTKTHVAWSTTRGTPRIPSPIVVDDLMFTVSDAGGIVRCLNPATGDELWRKRIGGNHWASPLWAAGNLYFCSKEGEVTVLSASREEPEGVKKSRLKASFIASPAVAGSALLLRSTTHLYCVRDGYSRTQQEVAADDYPARVEKRSRQRVLSSDERLTALGVKLKALVKSGKLNKQDALELYQAASVQDSPASEKSDRDWEAAYAELLKKDPGVRDKIEGGQATKADVIGWLKRQASSGADRREAHPELAALRKKLAEFAKAGKLTTAKAADLWRTMAGTDNKGRSPQGAMQDWDAVFERLLTSDPTLKQKIDQGQTTKAEVIAWLKSRQASAGQRKKRGKPGARPGSVNFYAIVIGRLQSKDIELGEMEILVDYVISDHAKRNAELIGKRVRLVGVAGSFLDSLLQIKRGHTLKVRTGDYNPKTQQLGFGYKFQVLERTAPFDPADFGVPPEEFRGFHGELTGKIVEVSGYELLLEVQGVKPSAADAAKQAESILGKRIRIGGFYGSHRDAYEDLHQGDTIKVSTRHRNRSSDSLEVTDVLQKLR